MERTPKSQSKKTWIVVCILVVALVAAAAGFYRYGQSKSVTELDAPTLTEAAEGADGVRVTWTAVKNAGSYWVFKRDVRGFWAFLGATDSRGLSYVDAEGNPVLSSSFVSSAAGVMLLSVNGSTAAFAKS